VLQRTLLIFSVGLLLACQNQSEIQKDRENDVLLAKVKNQNLYISDLPEMVFFNIEKVDSIATLKNYTQEWINEEILLLKAKENISKLEEINQEVKDYEKALINKLYEKEILNSLEIDISEDELMTYYNNHLEYFVFDENHYEIQYILLPKETSNLAVLKKAISKGKETNWMINYCHNNIDKCHISKSSIKNKKKLTEELHIPRALLKVGTKYKFQYVDNKTVMIYKIITVFRKGDVAPMKLVQTELTNLAIHNKKQEYLLELKEKTLQKAKNDKIFENYIN